MYYLYGRALVFCHILLNITFYYRLPLGIIFFTSLATHQYQTCMQEKLHLSADFGNAFYIGIYGEVGVSHTSVLISLVQKVVSKITTRRWVGRKMEFHVE